MFSSSQPHSAALTFTEKRSANNHRGKDGDNESKNNSNSNVHPSGEELHEHTNDQANTVSREPCRSPGDQGLALLHEHPPAAQQHEPGTPPPTVPYDMLARDGRKIDSPPSIPPPCSERRRRRGSWSCPRGSRRSDDEQPRCGD